jgi:uncharacterized protein (DUF488 family)
MIKTKKIFTMGLENVEPRRLVSLCKKNRIKKVVDIRRFAVSNREPYYDKDALRSLLNYDNIEYLWMGDSLGGFREVTYESYATSKRFATAIDSLEREVEKRNTMVICIESDWTKCHRRYVGESLEKKGWMVVHLEPEKQLLEAPPIETRRKEREENIPELPRTTGLSTIEPAELPAET